RPAAGLPGGVARTLHPAYRHQRLSRPIRRVRSAPVRERRPGAAHDPPPAWRRRLVGFGQALSGSAPRRQRRHPRLSPGHPDLKVSYAWDAKSRLASVTVKQAEPAKGAAPGRLFALDFDLGFVLADGSVHTIPARLDTVERTFAVHLADEPLRVRFDPGFGVAVRTASFDLPLRMLQRQLADDPDVLLRIDAAKALGKK